MFYFHLFFKIKDPFDGRSFLMCSHDPFFGTNKNRILKNGSCERDLTNSNGRIKGAGKSLWGFPGPEATWKPYKTSKRFIRPRIPLPVNP